MKVHCSLVPSHNRGYHLRVLSDHLSEAPVGNCFSMLPMRFNSSPPPHVVRLGHDSHFQRGEGGGLEGGFFILGGKGGG